MPDADAVTLHYRLSWDHPWAVVTVFKDPALEQQVKDGTVGFGGLSIQILRIDQPLTKAAAIALGKELLGVTVIPL